MDRAWTLFGPNNAMHCIPVPPDFTPALRGVCANSFGVPVISGLHVDVTPFGTDQRCLTGLWLDEGAPGSWNQKNRNFRIADHPETAAEPHAQVIYFFRVSNHLITIDCSSMRRSEKL